MADSALAYGPASTRPGPGPGPLGRLAGLSFRRRGRVLIGWLLALGIAIGLGATFGGEFTNGATLPGSDSQRAQDLLVQRFPAQAGDRIDVVVRAEDVSSDETRRAVGSLLADLRTMPHVAEIGDPYASPEALAQSVAPDGRTLVARLYLDVENRNDMPVEDTKRLLSAADAAEDDGLEVALSGGAVQLAEAPKSSSELIGLLAAAVILLLVFGSLVAAGLPLVMAIASLAVSTSLVGLVAVVADVPDFAKTIAALLGIAIGIDYALLMVTRYREWRAAGLDSEAATVATLDTAGRAVLVAGGTVMVSMLGLFAMGLSIMNGTALVTMVAVLIVLAAATTLFPAMMGYWGKWIERLRLPVGRRRRVQVRADGQVAPAQGWIRWSRLVQRYRVLATLGGTALLLTLAAPFFGITFAIPDGGDDPEDTSNRQAYDMLAAGFGPGYNGPLSVVVALDGSEGTDSILRSLRADLEATEGVADVSAPTINPEANTALLTVVPTTGPKDDSTVDLVHTVRDEVIPRATSGSDVTAYVGGRSAISIDLNSSMIDRLPFLIGGVVLVAMVLLLVAFRSPVIALTGAVMNLLSVAAAYGVLAFFFEGGWAGGLVGIDDPAPVAGYVPMIMFALLFGLSMDYQVFLISRMRETWVRSHDNHQAVVAGLASTGRVITAAAGVMIVVFAMLIAKDDISLKAFGIGMVAAVLIDATLVRMLLVPAVMHLLGTANWWLPRSMDRWLPQLHVEGRPEVFLPADPETDAVAVPA